MKLKHFLPGLLAVLLVLPAAAQTNPVSVFQFAIFYDGLLEFTWCAPMMVNGRTHANGDIYTGTAWPLTFNGLVTASGTISSPPWDGRTTSQYTVSPTYNAGYSTNWQHLFLPLGTNPHAIIDLPPAGENPTSPLGQQRYFNKADVLLLVSNATVTVMLKNSPTDPVPTCITANYYPTNTSPTNYLQLTTNFPWLTLTNTFSDQRESKLVKPADIDMGRLARWLITNASVNAKFPNTAGAYNPSNVPNILYVADARTIAAGQLAALRLRNGTIIPTNWVRDVSNHPSGFTVATPNPLYVWGTYNCPDSSALGTTNTALAYPASLISDALTILSPNWMDSQSSLALGATGKNSAISTTINAAIIAGNVPSTGPGATQFSGGVHNLPRLLEDWGSGTSQTLTLNTSFVNLFPSLYATNQFQNPGAYYQAPSRQFSHDPNFASATKMPPGSPQMLFAVSPQPPSQTVAAGQTAMFSVAGFSPCCANTYQWLFNGSPIPGAVSDTLIITNASASSSGLYSVNMNTSCLGNLISSNAVLTVAYPPVISWGPSSQAALPGSSVAFSVLAASTAPLSYQWQFNGSAIAGATNSSLTLNAVQSANTGSYTVVLTNVAGSVTSRPALLTLANPQDFLWAQAGLNGSSTGGSQADGVAVDAFGQVLAAGRYSTPTLNLGGVVLTNNGWSGTGSAGFICKYDGSGNLLWARQACNNTGNPSPLRVGTDASGNVWLAGRFVGNVSFGTNVFVSGSPADLFVAKYGPQGQVLWARQIRAYDDDLASIYFGFAVDANGNAFVASRDTGSANFGSVSLTNSAGFLAKYDTAGNLVWAGEALGADAIAVGSDGAVCLTGSPGFLAKYDSLGNLMWSNSFPIGQSLVLDAQNNLYATGYGAGTYDGLSLTNSGGGADFFVARCDPQGHLLWLRQAGGIQQERGTGIALDGYDNVYVTGLSATANFEPVLAFGSSILTNVMTFVAKYDSAGNALWAVAPVVTSTAGIYGITVADPAEVCVAGSFSGSAAFGSFVLNGVGSQTTSREFVVAKLAGVEPAPPGIATQPQSQLVAVSASTTFTATVPSSPLLACQWLLNGTNVLAGATNLSLTLTNVQLSDAGQYAVVVSNVYGSATSSPASLAVFSLPPTNCTACSGQPGQFTLLANSPVPLLYQWQVSADGGTTFTNVSGTATNASYTNLVTTPADNGNQYRVIVSSAGDLSQTSSPPAVLTVSVPATASAGDNQTICSSSCTAGLSGSVGGGATGGQWTSSGTGTFAPDATTLNASYTPSGADTLAGTVTLGLTTTGQAPPCGAATAQVVVTINPAANASAGGAQTICSSSATAGLSGSVGGGATGGTWSSPTGGTFLPNATTLNASYTASAADVTAGAVTLTLTTTGQQSPCGAATVQVVVIIHSVATAYAGGNQTICAGHTTTGLGGAVAGGATCGRWTTSGTGFFVPGATTLNTHYSPSAADRAAGTVTLTLSSTGQQAPCGEATAQVVVTINPRPAAPTTIGAVIFGAGTVSLSASGSGGTFNWYSDLGLSTLVNTGPIYSPTVGGTTSYYVTETSAGGCLSAASPVTATVNPPSPVRAGVTLSTLFSFAGTNGATPSGTLVQGRDGNLYGVARNGGAYGNGTVFKMALDGTFTLLASFANTNGSASHAGLVLGADGNFYGTTAAGGTFGLGTIFKVTSEGALTTLVSFNGTNGANPGSELTQGNDGNLYGTAPYGGLYQDPWKLGYGTIFQVTPGGVLTTLVWFNGTNGGYPLAGLVQGADGDFYSTTLAGGVFTNTAGALIGTAFKMTPAGALTTLLSFDGTNGAGSNYGLAKSQDGNFYGTTLVGAFSAATATQLGNIFRLTPDGLLTPLFWFNGTNGAVPGGLMQASDGNFYGAALVGGADYNGAVTGAGGSGTIFEVTPDGALTTLVTFTNKDHPFGRLVQASDGNLYGTTLSGGAYGNGTIFRINLTATASAGGNQTICADHSTAGLGGTVSGDATGGIWSSSGTGTFSPDATTLNATYQPAAADCTAGTVTLTLTTTGGTGVGTANVVVTIGAAATVAVGGSQTICSSGATSGLGGTVGGGATGATWSTTTGGTFSPNATTLNASYTASAADISAGAVTLTLTSTGQQSPCAAATAQVVVTVNKAATASAGNNQTICSSDVTAGLGGTVGGGTTGGTWTSTGDGTFAPDATTLNATYTPSAADISAGTVTLTLTATGQQSPCAAATAQVVVTIYAAASAGARGNQTICAGHTTTGLGGTVGGGATGGRWTTSGTGFFVPGATTLNTHYSPSAADRAAGTVTLTLASTGQQMPCGEATAHVVVTINALPAITNPPTNLTVCAGSPAIFSVRATGAVLSYQWQVSADGGTTFTNVSDTATSVSYTNLSTTLADNSAQYRVVVSGACSPAQTSAPPAVLTVLTPATASAGAGQTICAGSDTAALGGTVGGGATGGTWTSSGSGSFAPHATTLNATYTPSAADISAGTVTLTLTSTGQAGSCDAATAQVVATINISGQPGSAQSLVDNHNGTYTLNLVGTPGAQYYAASCGDMHGSVPLWTPVAGSTNIAGADGKWSCVVSNPSPAYYRPFAMNPAP